jgi:hypothetical protein
MQLVRRKRDSSSLDDRGPTDLFGPPTRMTVGRQLGLLPFPDRMMVRLKYAETIVLSTNLSSLASGYQFRMSSTFDPNSSGVGHQPYQRDQIASLYAYYKVRTCKYKVTAHIPNYEGLWAGVNIYSSLASGSVNGLDVPAIQERNHTDLRCVPNAGKQIAIFTGSVDLAGVHGLTQTQYDADNSNYGGAQGGNPGQNAMLEIVFADPAARTASAMYFQVELEYYVQEYGYIPPSQS